MTPKKVLESKTVKMAAARFAEWLRAECRKSGDSDEFLFLWSPAESRDRGYGDCWTVCWEDGPFEWTMVCAGSGLYGAEMGDYGSPGPFPNGLDGDGWHSEPQNGFMLCFYS